MSSTDLLVVLLFAALAVWLVTVLVLEARATGLRAGTDHAALVRHAGRSGRFGLRLVLPVALVAAIAGVLLVRTDDWSYAGSWWIGACTGLWLVTMFLCTTARGPQNAKLVSVAAEEGPDAEDVLWRARELGMLARGELLLLAVAITLLVLQPS